MNKQQRMLFNFSNQSSVQWDEINKEPSKKQFTFLAGLNAWEGGGGLQNYCPLRKRKKRDFLFWNVLKFKNNMIRHFQTFL